MDVCGSDLQTGKVMGCYWPRLKRFYKKIGRIFQVSIKIFGVLKGLTFFFYEIPQGWNYSSSQKNFRKGYTISYFTAITQPRAGSATFNCKDEEVAWIRPTGSKIVGETVK